MIDRLRQKGRDANLGANIKSMLIDQVIRDRRFRQHELMATNVRRPN